MQASSNKILEEVPPLRIIREVEKWPVIYERDNPEMVNPHFKFKVWEQVAKNLFDDFQSFSTEEQQVKVQSLMRKWRNLRDTFKRQLMFNKKKSEGHNIKRKEYVYYKHMLYLLPHVGEEFNKTRRDEVELRPPQRSARRRYREQVALLPSTSSVSEEHIDEDKHFLLSLLPSFKRMNDDEKLTAKMEILKVIKDVKNSSVGLETLMVETLSEDGIKKEHMIEDIMDGSDDTD